MVAEMFLKNASELLAVLCFVGIIATVVRWRTSYRRAFLLAFAAFLAGTMMRELVVWFYGPRGWPDDAVHLSAVGRVVQIVGSVLFIRASLVRYCGEWGWLLVILLAAVGAMIL